MIEIKSEILRSDTLMAMEIGRMESTLEAVERWYKYIMEQNKDYHSFTIDVRPLGVILGIEEEFEEEQKPEAKASADITIKVEAGNAST